MNQLILGDCLEALKCMPAESVDLVYLDPPFFSNRHYEIVWGDKGEIRSFEDRWAGGIDHYIAWLKERVAELHRLLKPTGSLFLHCDWHANAYIRVHILDKIFGPSNFRNEIIWKRHNAHNKVTKKLPILTDTIFYYTKSNDYTLNMIYEELSAEYQDAYYRRQDEKGFYCLSDLTGAGVRTGESSVEWRGYNPTPKNRHWAVPGKAVEELVGVEKAQSMTVVEKLELLYDNGLIVFSKNGIPSFKRYRDTSKGNVVGNIWDDISGIRSQRQERVGYPTQKPLALLERIIACASNEGDVVLDPFVGGGTTVLAAERLKRRWIGIDQSPAAIKVTEMRLQKEKNLYSSFFTVKLHKYDYDTLRYKDAFEFETWIIERYGGIPNDKQRSDYGLDGKTRDGLPIQVKRSENVGRNVLDNFVSAAKRFDKALFDKNVAEGKPVGVIIAFSFGKGAIQEAARLKNEEGIIVSLTTVEEIVPIAKKPTLKLEFEDLKTKSEDFREIKFTATGQSEAGIAFYGWDWDYDESKGFEADVYLDKIGVQTQKFKPGIHSIAVKIVDQDGLENVEAIKLHVNGIIKTL